jgi:peptidoglycan/xylan/chitin deacetylase (PgdA/CDA1 family)
MPVRIGINSRVDSTPAMLQAFASRPKRIIRRAASFLMGTAVVLLYHRVHDPKFDPQLLSVSPGNFDAQMAHLRRRYAVLSLGELSERVVAGSVPRRAVAVTFDDGYADNFVNARPILDRYRIPATVFVTTGYIGAGREFWWDQLGRMLFFAPRLPDRLTLTVGGSTRQWSTGSASRMTVDERLADRSWNVVRADNPTELHLAYREMAPLLSLSAADVRGEMLKELDEQTGAPRPEGTDDLAMTRCELRTLHQEGLIGLGAHTVTHPVLSTLTREAAAQEIRQSKAELQEASGATVSTFAYPYGYRGAYTSDNMSDVAAAGMPDAYSNFGGAVRAGHDRLQLNRVLARNWEIDEFARVVRRAFAD